MIGEGGSKVHVPIPIMINEQSASNDMYTYVRTVIL